MASGTFKAALTRYGTELSKVSKVAFGKGGQNCELCGFVVVLLWPVVMLNKEVGAMVDLQRLDFLLELH